MWNRRLAASRTQDGEKDARRKTEDGKKDARRKTEDGKKDARRKTVKRTQDIRRKTCGLRAADAACKPLYACHHLAIRKWLTTVLRLTSYVLSRLASDVLRLTSYPPTATVSRLTSYPPTATVSRLTSYPPTATATVSRLASCILPKTKCYLIP